MTGLDKLLSDVLYRRSCPDPETLGEYYLGYLAPGERLAVALHLRNCPHCKAELSMYAPAAGEAVDSAPASRPEAERKGLADPVSRVRWAIARGKPSPMRPPRGVPDYSAGHQLGVVHGATELSSGQEPPTSAVAIRHVYESEDLDVILAVMPATTGGLAGYILGMVQPASAASAAELWNTAELLDIRPVRSDGRFFFAPLQAGAYFLCLREDDLEVWLEVAVAAKSPRRR